MKQIRHPSKVKTGGGVDFTDLDLDSAIAMLAEDGARAKREKTPKNGEEKPIVRPVFQDGWECTALVLINQVIKCTACGEIYESPGGVLIERVHKRHGKHLVSISEHIYIPGGTRYCDLRHRTETQHLTVTGCKKCFDLAELIEGVLCETPKSD